VNHLKNSVFIQEFLRIFMFYFMNVVCSFMNYAIFRELCDRMQFEVDCAKSHHRVIPEGLILLTEKNIYLTVYKLVAGMLLHWSLVWLFELLHLETFQ